jgi:DNA modification methylase
LIRIASSHQHIWPECLPDRKPTGHKSEKPVGLIKRLIAESGGDLILDPFVGSGTTLVAAKQLGRHAIGIEIEERWCEVAARRAEQAELAGRKICKQERPAGKGIPGRPYLSVPCI